MSRSNVRRMALAVLACAALVPTKAVADGWFEEMHEVREVSLADLLRNPHEYRDIEVTCKLYFNEVGRSFNPYYTRFIPEWYRNFSAWPFDARLYEKRDFQRSYPHFFMRKESKEWDGLAELERITSIEVHAIVRDVFRGQPWIEVLSWDTLGDGLRERDVKNAARGDAYYAAGRYDDAAEHYDRAIRSSLPESVQADLYRRLGDAQYAAGDYDDAEDSYERGLKRAPGSAVLERNVLAARQAYARSRGRAMGDVDETLAPRSEPVVQGERTGVDEIVSLFETPTAVEAEVDRYRKEIEERAATVAAQSGQQTEAAAGGEEQPAEDGADDGEVGVVEEPAEQEAQDEGCAEDDSWTEDDEGACGEEWAPEAEEAPPAEEPAEACAEEPAPATEVVEEAPAAEVVEEAPVVEAPAPQPVEEVKPKTLAEVLSAQGNDGSDGCAVEITEEDVVPPAPEEAAQPVEEAVEEAPAVEEAAVDEEAMESEPCGEEQAEGSEEVGVVEMTPEDEGSVSDAEFASDDPRVVMVAGSVVRLPRMPFFGCEDVSYDDFRSVVEEILRSPE